MSGDVVRIGGNVPRARLTVGVRDGQIMLALRSPSGDVELAVALKPDDADALSADLRGYAIELRNGGRLT